MNQTKRKSAAKRNSSVQQNSFTFYYFRRGEIKLHQFFGGLDLIKLLGAFCCLTMSSYYNYCKLVRGLDACLSLQLLPFISVLLGDATNGVASLLQLVYLTILCTNKIDHLQYSDRDRLTNVESILTIECKLSLIRLGPHSSDSPFWYIFFPYG